LPEGHRETHCPLLHTSCVEHRVLHSPQFVLSVWRSVHEAPHCSFPSSHRHLPSSQCVPPWQALLQPPQCWSSVFKSAHSSFHKLCPSVHLSAHCPSLQTWSLLHFVPQPPQL